MKYSEYTEGRMEVKPLQEQPKDAIESFDEYMILRHKIEEYEGRANIEERMTASDYMAYEANLHKIMDEWDYTDEENGIEESYWEKIQNHMNATGWTWGGNDYAPTIKDLKAQVVSLFESCMESGHPKAICSSGGFTVETDIEDHRVRVMFAVTDDTSDDNTDSVWM